MVDGVCAQPVAETEPFELAYGARSQAVAAGLVAGKAGLVDDDGVEPEAAGFDPGGDARRSRAHHENIHWSTVPTFRTGVPIAARIKSSGGATGSSARPERGATE